jgi:hydroxyethylthiazole kinase
MPNMTRSPGAELTRMREAAPLVQNITNYVAMNWMANVQLAVGAAPAMIHAPEEAGEFARIAGALTVNIGTLSRSWVEGMRAAADGANAAGRPWVFDPVAVGATSYRRAVARHLMELRPAAVRGNASEIMVLAGQGAGGRGVDSGDPVAAAESAARALALRAGCVVAVTGAEDYATDGERALRVAGGHALMPRITAMGCALTGVVGAFVAGAEDRLAATGAALACFAAAGTRAGRAAEGPGSFQVAFLDALAALDEAVLDEGARVTWE